MLSTKVVNAAVVSVVGANGSVVSFCCWSCRCWFDVALVVVTVAVVVVLVLVLVVGKVGSEAN